MNPVMRHVLDRAKLPNTFNLGVENLSRGPASHGASRTITGSPSGDEREEVPGPVPNDRQMSQTHPAEIVHVKATKPNRLSYDVRQRHAISRGKRDWMNGGLCWLD